MMQHKTVPRSDSQAGAEARADARTQADPDDKLKSWIEKFSETDALYFSSLYEQLKAPRQASGIRIGEDFVPSAMMRKSERNRLLNVVEYEELVRDRESFEHAARSVVLTLHPLNGGIGSSIKRDAYLKSVWKELRRPGTPSLTSKAGDLYFDASARGNSVKLNISQAKILRALRQSERYKRTVLQYLCSTETQASVQTVLEAEHPLEKKTLRGALSDYPEVEWQTPLVQSAFPTIDEDGLLSDERMAPGGHGHWSTHLLLRALKMRLSLRAETMISAVYNEEGINNGVDPLIAGYMAREGVPILMLFTPKTRNDRKGGQLGLGFAKEDRSRKMLLEKAQADENGQGALFEEMGLTAGEPGGQYFNTNTALFNYNVLAPFLQDLVNVIGMRRFLKAIRPDLIRNVKTQAKDGQKKKFIQLEGALGSALLNLDGFLSAATQPEVRKLLETYGFLDEKGKTRFLRVLLVETRNRTRFFTPIKTAFDFWLQFHSGLYRFNAENWELEGNAEAEPEARLSDYYDAVDRVQEAFAGTVLDGLSFLEVKGKVHFGSCVLRNRVRVLSALDGVVQLDHPEFRSQFPQAQNSKLALDNVAVRIDRSRRLTVQSHAQ